MAGGSKRWAASLQSMHDFAARFGFYRISQVEVFMTGLPQ